VILPGLGDASALHPTPRAGLDLALELEDVGPATDRPRRNAQLPGDRRRFCASVPQRDEAGLVGEGHGLAFGYPGNLRYSYSAGAFLGR
jgi:hypothetical protein